MGVKTTTSIFKMKFPTTVREIMTKDVVSVFPETSLLEAHALISRHNFDGVPVVDHKSHLKGILTEYDLLAKDSVIHIPTFQKIFNEIPVYRNDSSQFEKITQEIKRINVKDLMNTNPITFSSDTLFSLALHTFQDHHRVNPVPVIDVANKVIGVVSRYDILKFFFLFNK